MGELSLPPEAERLITMTLAIDRHGNVYQDTQTHNNTFAEVYRGTMCIKAELERLVQAQRQCPFHPKTERPHAR